MFRSDATEKNSYVLLGCKFKAVTHIFGPSLNKLTKITEVVYIFYFDPRGTVNKN